MINIFLVRYKDGGLMLETLPINKKGVLTKKAKESLQYRGFAAWVNLTACADDPRQGLKEMLAKEFGI